MNQSGSDFIDWLYDQYSGFVYSLAQKYCTHPQHVDDIVQSVWERLIINQDALHGKNRQQQLCYISVAVKNMVRYNARQNRVVIYSLEDVVIADSSSISRIEDSIDRKIRQEAFHSLWQEVDENTREILSRKYVHEEADASIAQSLGISANSVRTYLSRAKRTARVHLESHKDKLFPNK